MTTEPPRLDQVRADDAVQTVILTGAGEAFSAVSPRWEGGFVSMCLLGKYVCW